MDHATTRLYSQAGSVSVWHPETLDADALVKRYGQRVGEAVLWLGHCTYVGLADDARYRDAGRVPLKAEYLRNVIGRHYVDAVRRAALEIGYVDRDPSYRAGDHSQAYWVLPPYDHARLVRREIASPGLRLNIRKWLESRRRATWQRIERDETRVSVVACGAPAAKPQEVAAHLRRNLQRVRIDLEIDFGAVFDPRHQIAVEHLRGGELWFTVDDYGRIHTNLTSMPKTLRRYLSVDGVRLANIDIGESQPVFLGLALAREYLREDQDKDQGEGETTATLPYDGHTMMDKNPQLWGEIDRGRLPSDLRSYLAMCESRGLYQAVADRLGKTRDEVKKLVMVAFYGKPSLPTAASRVLRELFPAVMLAMRDMKRPDHRRLAHFAQRIESAFMFRGVIPRIMALRPDLFISTIHDSILTTGGDAEFVRGVMLDEFARLGLSPQVKVEPCSETC